MGPLAILAVAGGVFMLFIFLWMSINLYKKCGPNEAMIISGFGTGEGGSGFKIIVGGGDVVLPMLQQVQTISLAAMPIELKNHTPIITTNGVPLSFDAVAQVKVKSDVLSIATAAERFLGKSGDEIKAVASDILKTHLREVVGTMTAEEVLQNLASLTLTVQEISIAELMKMGLTIDSFSIREISDCVGYLESLGKQAALDRAAETR
jgi:flotillin